MDILIHVDSLNLKILWLLKNCADVFVTFAIHDLYEAASPGCRGCWLQGVLAPGWLSAGLEPWWLCGPASGRWDQLSLRPSTRGRRAGEEGAGEPGRHLHRCNQNTGNDGTPRTWSWYLVYKELSRPTLSRGSQGKILGRLCEVEDVRGRSTEERKEQRCPWEVRPTYRTSSLKALLCAPPDFPFPVRWDHWCG